MRSEKRTIEIFIRDMQKAQRKASRRGVGISAKFWITSTENKQGVKLLYLPPEGA